MDKNEYQSLSQNIKKLFKDYDMEYDKINIYYNPPSIEFKKSIDEDEEDKFMEFTQKLSDIVFPEYFAKEKEKMKDYTFDKNDLEHVQNMVDAYKKQVINYDEITELLKNNKYKYTPEDIKRKYSLSDSSIELFDYLNHENTYKIPIELNIKTNLITTIGNNDNIELFIDNMSKDINNNKNIKIKVDKENLYRFDIFERVYDNNENVLFTDDIIGILTDYED